jgi:hypothetical protein
MKKMTRNFVSISFALALCGGISGMVFAQDADAPVWSTPSTTSGTFNIGVQTVYDGFVVTTPFKTYNEKTGEWEAGDAKINEDDDADQVAQISISAAYDNSDASGVGYSFGVGGGIKRVNNYGGTGFDHWFDSPWGKAFFFEKQLTLRVGSLEELWKAWDDNWDYGPFDGGVQLNINPSFLGGGLNVGVSLPIRMDSDKADYPFKNMVAGFKLGGLIPNTTLSAALKLRETGAYTTTTKVDGTGTVTVDGVKLTGPKEVTVKENLIKDTMDLNAALDVNFSPIHIYAEMQISDFNQTDDDLEKVSLADRTVKFQFHPRIEFSVSSLIGFEPFSSTFSVWSWIKDDPLYVSNGSSVSLGWDSSYKFTSAITALLYLESQFGGDGAGTLEGTELDDYNKVGFYVRPGIAFGIAPNAEIRLRDQVTFAEVGTDPKAGIKNQVQVRFAWGF